MSRTKPESAGWNGSGFYTASPPPIPPPIPSAASRIGRNRNPTPHPRWLHRLNHRRPRGPHNNPFHLRRGIYQNIRKRRRTANREILPLLPLIPIARGTLTRRRGAPHRRLCPPHKQKASVSRPLALPPGITIIQTRREKRGPRAERKPKNGRT